MAARRRSSGSWPDRECRLVSPGEAGRAVHVSLSRMSFSSEHVSFSSTSACPPGVGRKKSGGSPRCERGSAVSTIAKTSQSGIAIKEE